MTNRHTWAKPLAQSALALCLSLSCLSVAPVGQALAKEAKSTPSNVPFVGNTLKTKKGDPRAIALGDFGRTPTKYGPIVGATKSYKDDDYWDNAVKPEDAEESAVTTPTIPSAVLPNPTTEEFIALIGEQAREIGQERGLYASVMIAQAILESGSGGSGLSKPPYNNLFGIKGSYKGSAVYMLTSEDDGSGNYYDIVAAFRSYPSTRESLEDYADLLTVSMGDFYAPAWKANAATYADACDYLQGHYATSTTYSSSLQGLIIAYDLEQFDHPADAAGSEAAAKDHAKGMLAAVPIGGGRSAKASVETDFSDIEAAGETTDVEPTQWADTAGAVPDDEAALEAISTFAKSPAGQTVAFAAGPLVVVLVFAARGGVAALALPVAPKSLLARIAAFFAR